MMVHRRWLVGCLALSLLLASGCQQAGDSISLAAVTPPPEPAPPAIVRGRIEFVDNYEAGLAQAREQGKPVLLYFTAHACRYCNEMAADAFCQDPVVAVSERFVCVLVDTDEQPRLCEQHKVDVLPTLVFLSHDGEALERVTGKQLAHRLVMEMQAALQSVARLNDWSPTMVR